MTANRPCVKDKKCNLGIGLIGPGFSGYVLHRKLENAGIRNIVVNPASIAIASNDKVKTDLRDSKKLAVELSDKRLGAIYIPTVDEELDRL